VGDNYFAALRMTLRSGRVFARGDNESAPRVAVVNEILAKQLAPAGDALGMTFLRGREAVTVVGIVRNARYENLSEAMPPVAYFSLEQFWQPHQTLLVRSSASHAQLAPAIMSTIRSIDSALPAPPMTTLAHATGITLVTQRIAATISGVLGGVGFLLATLGLYGSIAYSVNRRAREIGIRVALGAQRTDALGLVLGEGIRLAVGGILVGVIAAAAATRLIAGFLFDVSALDATTFGFVSTAFLLVACIATYVPARRAANADPMITLRTE
jgi:ABC-type antimicrobial peptide transport system permease subunit